MLMNTSAAEEETILRIGFMQDVDTLNPLIGLNDASYVFYGLVYDALNVVNNTFGVDGNLALSWQPVPEDDPQLEVSGEPYYSVWEYVITENASWHDHEPLTVNDVVFTVNLNAENYESMWAYQPYSYWMHYAEESGPNKVRIHFYDRVTGEPSPAVYPYLLAIPVLPEHVLGDYSPYDLAFNWTGVVANSDPPIVGTGPFMATDRIYEEWEDGDYINLVKNPDYHWKADKGKEIQFDRIRMYFYDEAAAMRIALENREIDVAQFPPNEYREMKGEIASGDLENMVAFDGLKVTQYWTEIAFNMANAGPNPARLDPAVRHALAMATNKTYIVENFYHGYAEEGTTLVSPIDPVWHYEPTADELFEFDLNAANALLESSGYTDSDGDGIREARATSLAVLNSWVSEDTPLSFEMMIRREYPEERDIAAYLKQVWEDVGVDLDVQIMSEAALGTIAYTYTYDTMIWYWSDDPDPNFMLFCMSEKAWNGWNDNYYTSPGYEENYTNSVMEPDPDLRKTYVDNAQRIHYLDAAYIILAYPYQTYIWRTDTFTGWGDWEANPGRSIDHFWTGNPLYFDLVPHKVDGDGRYPVVLLGVGIAVAAAAVVGAVLLSRRIAKKREEQA
ncbi:MAG: hypothetical protein A3K67_00050 [Euryarchaeota archaeon RBG_16_62_10]|nr:MAG: hypothetical protein A3K67_00050 [Euryarchaeota archaeon RBG_16_62_10]